MLKLEILILTIGLIVFLLQNKIRIQTTEASKKIVYWTVMFFISLSFNTILFTNYGEWYDINTYLNLNTFLIILAIILGCIVIQMLSPFKSIINLFKKLFKRKISTEEKALEEALNKESKYERQRHFEIFLETICWIGFIALIAIECYISIIGTFMNLSEIESNFALVICLTVMLTLPISLRQILFYLFNIRSINKGSLSSEQILLQEKLQKTNIKL